MPFVFISTGSLSSSVLFHLLPSDKSDFVASNPSNFPISFSISIICCFRFSIHSGVWRFLRFAADYYFKIAAQPLPCYDPDVWASELSVLHLISFAGSELPKPFLLAKSLVFPPRLQSHSIG